MHLTIARSLIALMGVVAVASSSLMLAMVGSVGVGQERFATGATQAVSLGVSRMHVLS